MNKKIKSLLTLAKFRKWLNSRPDDETFYYYSPHDCAIARFLKANKIQVSPEGASVVSNEIWTQGKDVPIPASIRNGLERFLARPVADGDSTMGTLKKFFKK